MQERFDLGSDPRYAFSKPAHIKETGMTDTRQRNTVLSVSVTYADPNNVEATVIFGRGGTKALPEAIFWSDRGPEILGAYYDQNPRPVTYPEALAKYGAAIAGANGPDVETNIDPEFVRQLWRSDSFAMPLPTLLVKNDDCTPDKV
jgi:hypothetical protein